MHAQQSNLGERDSYAYVNTGYLKTDTIAITDVDSDGISDAWELSRSGRTALLGTNSDRDGDGVSDLNEFRADTDPLASTSRPQVTIMIQILNGEPATSITTGITWPSSSQRLYKIQFSSNLTSWSDAAPDLFLPDAGSTTTRSVTHAISDKVFFRIQSARPLAP